MSLVILERLEEHARLRPRDEAVRLAGPEFEIESSLDYAQLHASVLGLSAKLQQRLAAGSTLLLCSTNQPAYTVAFLAALRSGLRVLPVSAEWTAAEVGAAATASSASLALVSDRVRANLGAVLPECWSLESVARTQPGGEESLDLSLQSEVLLHSSGSTAKPRIVRRSGSSLDRVATAIARALGLLATDTVLACVPMSHSYGMEHGLLAPLIAGCRSLHTQGFLASWVASQARNRRISVLPGVPVMFEALSRLDPHDFATGSLRLAYSAGAPLPQSIEHTLREKLGLSVGQLYGATEIGSITFQPPGTQHGAPACVGKPMTGVNIRILELQDPGRTPASGLAPQTVGQIAVDSPFMLTGYLDDPPPPLVQGCFLTGDMGMLDEQGRLWITGRTKLLIDIGGLKVNPLEIEEVLRGHPAVAECVVVPLQVSPTIVRLRAVLTLRSEQGAVSTEELRQYARQRLAPYKVPRVFEVRATLPRTSAGKIHRQAIGAMP